MTCEIDFAKLKGAKRLLIEAQLRPIQGERFQTTGFADLGAATYQLPDGTRMLLVESAQSMANRFEQALMGPDNKLIPELEGLPYVAAKLEGDMDTVTNSLLEAHRLNSPYIISDKDFKEAFSEKAGYQRYLPLDWRKIAAAVLHYDANALLHGVFMANLEDGRIKMPRALSAFIEARNTREVFTGGVKNNSIDPTGKMRAVDYDKDVYGNVPYQRVEFTAGEITAYFNLDLGQLRGFGLSDEAVELLIALALYKIAWFLDEGTRLRTACDLAVHEGPTVKEPSGFVLPERESLLACVQDRIKACKKLFADPPVTEVTTKVKLAKKGSDQTAEAE